MSTKKIVFDIRYANGAYMPTGDRGFSTLIAFCKENDQKKGWITFQVGERNRSLEQNRFFHGPLMVAFTRATGEDDHEYTKYYLKEKFLKVTEDGSKFYIRDTSGLNVKEFSEFLTLCIRELSECGGHLDAHEYEGYQYVGNTQQNEKEPVKI